MRGVDPAPRQVRQSSEVVGLRQHPGLEPAHGTGRGRTMLQRATTNNPVHHRIATQSVGVVDVLVAGEAVPSIPPCARVADKGRELREWLEERGTGPVIPPRKNRKIRYHDDQAITGSEISSNACSAASKTGGASQLASSATLKTSWQLSCSPQPSYDGYNRSGP